MFYCSQNRQLLVVRWQATNGSGRWKKKSNHFGTGKEKSYENGNSIFRNRGELTNVKENSKIPFIVEGMQILIKNEFGYKKCEK